MVYTLADGTQATRRKKVVLTGAASGARTDYQLKLAATYAAAMQSNFDDVRFTKADTQTLIDAWLESKVDGTSADVWAEFPTTPANGVAQDYWMYYGNSAAVSDWDIGATFLFGDDFVRVNSSVVGNGWVEKTDACWSIDNNKLKGTWVSSYNYDNCFQPYIISNSVEFHSKLQFDNVSANWYMMAHTSTLSDLMSWLISSSSRLRHLTSGGWVDSFKTYAANTDFISVIRYNNDSDRVVYLLPDHSWSSSAFALSTTGVHTNKFGFQSSNATKTMLCDWAFVCKWCENPATYAFGSEEHQRRTPMMM